MATTRITDSTLTKLDRLDAARTLRAEVRELRDTVRVIRNAATLAHAELLRLAPGPSLTAETVHREDVVDVMAAMRRSIDAALGKVAT